MATERVNKGGLLAKIPGELDCLFCLKAKDEPSQFRRARSRPFSLWKRPVKKPIPICTQTEIEHEAR